MRLPCEREWEETVRGEGEVDRESQSGREREGGDRERKK